MQINILIRLHTVIFAHIKSSCVIVKKEPKMEDYRKDTEG